VLALTLDIELFTQVHYTESIAPDAELSALFKDVFLYHWKEESQHAILDELEIVRNDAELTPGQRDRAVTEFIELVAAVDGILQAQARNDATYFVAACGRTVVWRQPHVRRVSTRIQCSMNITMLQGCKTPALAVLQGRRTPHGTRKPTHATCSDLDDAFGAVRRERPSGAQRRLGG